MRRIAVIGSGISGMASAYLLSRDAHVTLYEKNAVAGGHTRTLTVDYGARRIAVDTGFIVFNHATYPNLLGLFAALGVATEESDMSFSFTRDGGAFEWGARTLNSVFAQRRNLISPRFYRMLRDAARFFKHAESTVQASPLLTLGGLMEQMQLGPEFRNHFLLPMGAAIWSAPADQMLAFPALSFVRFFKNHGLLSFTGQHQWYTVTGGAQEYVKKVLLPIQSIRLQAEVVRIEIHGERPAVITRDGDCTLYDEVILASHADEALAMIDTPTAEERAILAPFQYQENIAYLHNDRSMMPKRRACWSSWNYHADGKQGVAVTYWMNLLQNIDPNYPLFVTLNPAHPIEARCIFNRHRFTHPIFTREAIAAQEQIPLIQGKRHLWFCGAYQRNGFHEDGLWSAVQVARAMGVSIPWQ